MTYIWVTFEYLQTPWQLKWLVNCVLDSCHAIPINLTFLNNTAHYHWNICKSDTVLKAWVTIWKYSLCYCITMFVTSLSHDHDKYISKSLRVGRIFWLDLLHFCESWDKSVESADVYSDWILLAGVQTGLASSPLTPRHLAVTLLTNLYGVSLCTPGNKPCYLSSNRWVDVPRDSNIYCGC